MFKYIVNTMNVRNKNKTYQVQLIHPELRPSYYPGDPSQPNIKYEVRLIEEYTSIEDAINMCRILNDVLNP
jgi:hypothetical protein